MRIFVSGLAMVALSLLFLSGTQAGDKKDTKKSVTLKGTITCAKCDLGVEKACATVVVAKSEGKEITVYFDAASNKKHHGDICTEAKKGTVTGVVTTTGNKKTIAVSALKYE